MEQRGRFLAPATTPVALRSQWEAFQRILIIGAGTLDPDEYLFG
jgi:hypothetical protein